MVTILGGVLVYAFDDCVAAYGAVQNDNVRFADSQRCLSAVAEKVAVLFTFLGLYWMQDVACYVCSKV